MEDKEVAGQAAPDEDKIVTLTGMYEDYFLDYASYVILERAVPGIVDGLKPVQRRILHAIKEMDDGRYHKVANVIGQTMQFHPHGDAAIGDALVGLGQKDLLIDPQGNWGDVRTGDSAAASRYIEARLTKFALDVAFNAQTTEWQLSYDGRKREPVALPMKFPLLLAQGTEGIAVGLSTKILPHNFIELIKASIKILEDKPFKIYPDFIGGGLIDVDDYQDGKRGGRVKVRALVEKVDNKTLAIRELPYGVTVPSMIDSIIKANDKGKIKIKHVVDNTAADVEILIELAPGTSPDLTMDALYAFTNCEVSVAPNACVIIDEKPHFVTVKDLLRVNTENTRNLLKWELDIEQKSLEEKLHFASLEKIFIRERIYRDIEEAESWEQVLEIIRSGLNKYVREPGERKKPKDKRIELLRAITEDDITRLTEIRIKRISKYNSFKADELIAKLEEDLKQVKHHLANLTEYAIDYYQRILDKYGKGRERRTKITGFEKVEVTIVAANNAKLYVDRKEGFIGSGLKKDEFVADCSDIDDIIVFLSDGTMKVVRLADKVFIGKGIEHVDVWRKGDERTTYNMLYLNGDNGRTMAKRFHIKAITRDKFYPLTKGKKGSKLLYLTANPNGEAETVTVQLSPASRAKIKSFDFDFADIDIKGRSAGGNIVTRYPVRKITLKEVGKSTLGALKVWMDEVSGRLNLEERGLLLGGFDTGDQLLVVYTNGEYEQLEMDLTRRFDPKELFYIGKYALDMVVSAVYYEGERNTTYVKRFEVETTSPGQRFSFIGENKQSKLYYATADPDPILKYAYRVKRDKVEEEIYLADFIDVKGWRSIGNKLIDTKLTSAKGVHEPPPREKVKVSANGKLKPGDSLDLNPGKGQGELF